MGNSSASETTGSYPTTGKAIAVRLTCSHDGKVVELTEHCGCLVTSAWTAANLQEAIEAKTSVHRHCQTLMYAGKTMKEDHTIQSMLASKSEQLPERINLFLLVDRDRFPQKLGPFRAIRAPFEAEDFKLPSSVTDKEFMRGNGFYWEMATGVLESHGLRARTARIIGQVSPSHSVLDEDEKQRKAAGIPSEACEFVFSYPVADWEMVENDVYSLNAWDHLEGAASMHSFLTVGGYIYFNDKGTVVSVTTLGRPQHEDKGGLHCGDPLKWLPKWSASFVEQGRFQPVTMKSLVEYGAKMFCWVRPNEIIKDTDGKAFSEQPVMPHGGFVYLFHDDQLASDEKSCMLDRYFPVVPSCDDSEASIGIFRPFSLIGEDVQPTLIPSSGSQRPPPVQEDAEESDDDKFEMTTCQQEVFVTSGSVET